MGRIGNSANDLFAANRSALKEALHLHLGISMNDDWQGFTPVKGHIGEPDYSANEAWQAGIDALAGYVLSTKKLSTEDRQLIARVLRYAHWEAFQRGSGKPAPEKPPARSAGRKSCIAYVDILLNAACIVADAFSNSENLDPRAFRNRVAEGLGLDWEQLRQACYKLPHEQQSFLDRIFSIHG